MKRVSCNGIAVQVSDDEPIADSPCELWIKESTGEIFVKSDTSWGLLPVATVGLTGTRTVGGFKFTFTKGLLTGFAPV